jgi:hypothetical protein
MEEVQQTVVDTSVDAGTAEVTTQETQSESQTVETTAVDAQETHDPKVGEAIRKEVERREAKLKEKYENESKTAAQQARDAYIAEQGYTWNGKPITTEAEYRQAEKDQAAIDAYREQKLPDDVIAELVEGKKFREKYTEAEQKSAERAKVESDFRQFTETFPDAKPEDIPTSVWADVNAGKSLVDAYTKYENQTLREKLAAVEQAKQIEQQNLANAASSTGSVTGNGTGTPTQFTRDQVEKMSRADVDKNFAAITASMKKW